MAGSGRSSLYKVVMNIASKIKRLRPYGLSRKRKTPRVGLEPTTPRLTAVCSTIELSRNIVLILIRCSIDVKGIFSACKLKNNR